MSSSPSPEATAYKDSPVLVTGGFGFLGWNLVKRLVDAGAKVSVLSRISPPLAPEFKSVLSRVTHYCGDIRNPDITNRAVSGVTTIFNLAGHSGAADSNADPIADLDVNGRGQLTLLESCRIFNRSARVVFSSSRLVYRSTDQLPVREDAPLEPLSFYGAHKVMGESYHRLYSRIHGIPTVILRITNPYGPYQRGDHKYGIVNVFIRTALADRPLRVFGDGHQLRDFVHVDDVVQAFLLAGTKGGADGEAFNIGGGDAIRFVDMAAEIVRIAGRGDVKHVEWPNDAAVSETGSFVANIEAAERRLGWRPKVRFALGLESAIRCYQEGQHE